MEVEFLTSTEVAKRVYRFVDEGVSSPKVLLDSKRFLSPEVMTEYFSSLFHIFHITVLSLLSSALSINELDSARSGYERLNLVRIVSWRISRPSPYTINTHCCDGLLFSTSKCFSVLIPFPVHFIRAAHQFSH